MSILFIGLSSRLERYGYTFYRYICCRLSILRIASISRVVALFRISSLFALFGHFRKVLACLVCSLAFPFASSRTSSSSGSCMCSGGSCTHIRTKSAT